MKSWILFAICMMLAVVGTAHAASTNITSQSDQEVTVEYHVNTVPASGVIQLYHMDWGYPVSVAEWSIVDTGGNVSINLPENNIENTTFYSRIITYNENGEPADYQDTPDSVTQSLWSLFFGWLP